ncbi:MAG: class I SAM-dependent methyltransferase [Polyangiaceae bacterium]
MAAAVVQNVPDTAFLVAMYRAKESERKDALFVDPYAALLAGERGASMFPKMTARHRMSAWSIAVRTVIIDDLVDRAVENGVDTIVNLGAGLDARPYRMALPESLEWIEVDYAHMLEHKEKVLAEATPTCKLERVKMDLADLHAREKLFADVDASSKNVLVITEGVIPYLTNEAVGLLADDLARMKNVRTWIVDYLSRQTLKYRKKVSGKAFRNAQFKFDPEDWFQFFAAHGWTPREERYLVEEGKKLGREVPFPASMKLIVRLARLLRRKRANAGKDEVRQFAGYFAMAPARVTSSILSK